MRIFFWISQWELLQLKGNVPVHIMMNKSQFLNLYFLFYTIKIDMMQQHMDEANARKLYNKDCLRKPASNSINLSCGMIPSVWAPVLSFYYAYSISNLTSNPIKWVSHCTASGFSKNHHQIELPLPCLREPWLDNVCPAIEVHYVWTRILGPPTLTCVLNVLLHIETKYSLQ